MYTGLAGSEAEHVFPVILCERVGWLMTPATNHFTAQVQRLSTPITGGYSWLLNKVREETDQNQVLGGRIVLFMVPIFSLK